MKRTVKIKANCSNNEDEILLIGKVQRNIKNYVWSRYGGISSLLKQSGWTILFDKYTKNFPQEVHNIFMWLWKDYSISIKSFNDLLDLKSSFKHYYKYIYIVYIQLLLHDLYLNKDAEIKPHLIKGGYNSYYNYNSIEFVPNTYYDVLKTESLYKYSTI